MAGSGGDGGEGSVGGQRDSALYILIFSVQRMPVPVVAKHRPQAFLVGQRKVRIM